MIARLLSVQTAIAALLAFALPAQAAKRVTCDSKHPFKAITAQEFADRLHPGWNPGNTMDAPHETDWGNSPLVNSTFANVKSKGFKGIRLPVSWTYHMNDTAPYTVDETWMQRVEDVIDMILSNGMYVMLNAHHDSWMSYDMSGTIDSNKTAKYNAKFYALWYQIGQRFACKSEMVGFEPLNEPNGSGQEWGEQLNTMQGLMLKAINDAGGHNAKRVVVIGGLGDSWTSMVQYTKLPTNVTNPIALTFHYYGPWDFTSNAWGRTIWGSAEDKANIENDFAQVRGNYTQYPLIVGEYGIDSRGIEPGGVWKNLDWLLHTGFKYNVSMMLWDTSASFVVNGPTQYGDQTALNIILSASKGISNALADTTTDNQAATQFTSAYLFQRRGEAIKDTGLPFIFNSHKLLSIEESLASTGAKRKLKASTDYSVDGTNLTFKAAYMSKLFPKNAAPEFKANLTLHFDQGADLILRAVLWDTPTINQTTIKATQDLTTSDLKIPLKANGITGKAASMKAQLANDECLSDTWTKWMGPLQKCRTVWGTSWDVDVSNWIIKAQAFKDILANNQTTTLTFEFFPRVPGNAVNFTVTV